MSQPPGYTDPFADREAEKYPHPVPSRECIIDFIAQSKRSWTLKGLMQALGLTSSEHRQGMQRRLQAMVRVGQLHCDRRRRYTVAQVQAEVTGRVQAHADGYGFVITDDEQEDIYLSAIQMKRVLHGDDVLVHVIHRDRRGRQEGIVAAIVQTHLPQIAGVIEADGRGHRLKPHDNRYRHRILLDVQTQDIGRIVKVQLDTHPFEQRVLQGTVLTWLGHRDDVDAKMQMVIADYELPHDWSDAVAAEVAQLPSAVPDVDQMTDLRALPFVTIDGADARDFDDAVFCETTAQGWRLWVAIAHVSYFVRPHTALDEAAHLRGTSVYFPQRVIHMLPEPLSCDRCSLLPDTDRLALVCRMDFNHDGEPLEATFLEAVIQSTARLTYEEVSQFLAEPTASSGAAWQPQVQILHDWYLKRQILRQQRHALELELSETRFVFDAQGQITHLTPFVRGVAHLLIEECMLCANVSAAEFLLRHRVPALFRYHPPPTEKKLDQLKTFLSTRGLSVAKDIGTPRDFAGIMTHLRAQPDADRLQILVLQCMSLARYSESETSHFGLAFDAYTHFTSPIRRYPDLLVHRAICRQLQGVSSAEHRSLADEAEHCSMTERRAEEATRVVSSWLKAFYMSDKVGQCFDGVVVHVVEFGLFVSIPDMQIEGLLHISDLPGDHYEHDAATLSLLGRYHRRSFRLGDAVQVRVAHVDLDEAKITFDWHDG